MKLLSFYVEMNVLTSTQFKFMSRFSVICVVIECVRAGGDDSYQSHLVDMVEHGLSPAEHFPTDRARPPTDPVLLLEVSEESLHEGSPLVTDVTSPGLVVLVISVHVVHQSSETAALLIT